MLRVKNWSERFENNRTRELKFLTWVPIPNGFDGDGYTQLMEMPEGSSIYGCWIAIINLASKCDPRGTLLRSNKKPHDEASIARMTRMNLEIVKKSIPVLKDVLNWLEEIVESSENASNEGNNPIAQEGATIPHLPATIPHLPAVRSHLVALNGMEGNGMEWKGKKKNRTFQAGDVSLVLSEELFKWLDNNSPGFKKPDLQKWALNVDLMLRLDRREPEQIRIVMAWAMKDPFWKTNILSTAALRKQFDRLKIQMGGKNGANRPSAERVSGENGGRKYADV